MPKEHELTSLGSLIVAVVMITLAAQCWEMSGLAEWPSHLSSK